MSTPYLKDRDNYCCVFFLIIETQEGKSLSIKIFHQNQQKT